MKLKKEDLIKKYENLEGVWNANGAEIARQCFLRDLEQLNEIDTEKVTVPQYVADSMRKTFGYHHYRKNQNVGILMELFNHSSPDITLGYIGFKQDELDNSMLNFAY